MAGLIRVYLEFRRDLSSIYRRFIIDLSSIYHRFIIDLSSRFFEETGRVLAAFSGWILWRDSLAGFSGGILWRDSLGTVMQYHDSVSPEKEKEKIQKENEKEMRRLKRSQCACLSTPVLLDGVIWM